MTYPVKKALARIVFPKNIGKILAPTKKQQTKTHENLYDFHVKQKLKGWYQNIYSIKIQFKTLLILATEYNNKKNIKYILKYMIMLINLFFEYNPDLIKI